MSDDPTQQQTTEAQSTNAGDSIDDTQTKRIKTEESGNDMNQEIKPLSQEPGPERSGPSSSIFRKLEEFEIEHARSGIPPSRYDKEHRAEYSRLLAEKDAYEEKIAAHLNALKGEKEFDGQEPRKWIDAINATGLGGNSVVVGFAAASANMHAKMMGQVTDLKRKLEDAEKRASTSPAQQQPAKSNTNAVQSFAEKPSPPPTNNNNNNNNNNNAQAAKPAQIQQKNSILSPALGKIAGLGETNYNPNQVSAVDGNSLLKAFSSVQYQLYGHSQTTQ